MVAACMPITAESIVLGQSLSLHYIFQGQCTRRDPLTLSDLKRYAGCTDMSDALWPGDISSLANPGRYHGVI